MVSVIKIKDIEHVQELWELDLERSAGLCMIMFTSFVFPKYAKEPSEKLESPKKH